MLDVLGWFKSKDLSDALGSTRTLKVRGVRFKIKKIDVLDHLTGAKALKQVFDTYQVGDVKSAEINTNKIKEHYSDVFMAAILSPKLCRKEGEDGTFVGHLFNDWELVEGLYNGIVEFTYGKKKVQAFSQKQNSLK